MRLKGMQKILLVFSSFGVGMGLVFPLYANYFVNWKDGMFVYFFIGCLIAGIIVGLSNFFIFKKIFKKLLDAYTSSYDRHLGIKIKCAEGGDCDIYELMESSFNTLINEVATLIKKIQETSALIQTTSEGLSGKIVNINDSSSLLENSIQVIVENSSNLSVQTLNSIKTIEGMIDVMNKIGSAVGETKRYSEETKRIMEHSRGSIKGAKQSMDAIRERFQDAKDAVGKLSQRSEEITKIVYVINRISEQTNLLALNAAIEASHAGDAGKGFAVVADEVRKLAEESQKATKQISGLIDEVNLKISDAVEIIVKGTKEMDGNSASIISSLESFNSVDGMIDQSLKKVDDVFEYTTEGLNSTKNVRESISEMKEYVSRNDEHSRRIAELNAKNAETVSNITGVADEMKKRAFELADRANRFDVK